jgi:hypothetical protein
MALIDRLAHDDGVESIPNHQFSAAVYFWAKGDITRQNVIDGFNLSATDETQLDQLSTFYTGLSAEDKQEFHSRMEAAGSLLETGRITKAFYRGLLGLT